MNINDTKRYSCLSVQFRWQPEQPKLPLPLPLQYCIWKRINGRCKTHKQQSTSFRCNRTTRGNFTRVFIFFLYTLTTRSLAIFLLSLLSFVHLHEFHSAFAVCIICFVASSIAVACAQAGARAHIHLPHFTLPMLVCAFSISA